MGQEYSSTSQGAELNEMKKKAGYTTAQLKVIKERFELLCDEDEQVDREIFASLLKMEPRDSSELFEFFDSDQSGKVDYYEFICALTLLSNSTIDEKAEIIFDVYDLDSSHRISADELNLLFKDVLESLNHMSHKQDADQGKMEAVAKKIFDRWDTDQDNSISITEFKSIISKDADILRLLISYGLMSKEELRTDFGGTQGDVPDCDSDLENEISHADADDDERTEKIKLGIEYKPKEKDPNALYEEEEMGGGDEFLAVKPWLGVVKNSVPTGYAPKKGEAESPEANLDLEYVHGYRCHDARNNLRYSPDNQAVYHTAAVGVILNQKDNTQKFFIEHTDDITCLDVYGNLVATGQIGAKPLVCIWDCTTRQTKAVFQGDLEKSIALVCFSNDGKRLAAIANNDDHNIGIFNLEKLLNPGYDIRKAKVDGAITIGKGPKANVLDAKFDPTNTTLIISCLKEVNFVSFEGGVVKCVKGSGWGNIPPQAVLCIGFIDNTIVTGGFSGNLFIWKGKALTQTIEKAHEGAVNAIWSRKTQKGVITGGNDGSINIWDQSLKKIQTIVVAKNPTIKSLNPKVRSVCENSNGNILVGLRGGEIVEFVKNEPKVLMRGHFDDELWGLCVNPSKNSYITAGEDMLLASWDVASRKQTASIKLDYKAKVLAFSPDKKFLAVGCVNGFVLIMDPSTFKLIQTLKDRSKEISELKFSPSSDLLAVGAHDSEIFTYNVAKGFKIQAKLRGHHSTVTHFDFSVDGNVLQSNCTSYEILYFDTKSGKRNPSGASANRNEKWATWTNILGWPVQGIWPECSDGSDINALDRHPQGNVIATGDDFSKVKLFKYPCPVERSSFVKVVGHSSHVTNVRFTADGSYLISTGGHDKSIFQWKYHFDHGADQQAEVINQSYVEEEEGEKADPNALFVQEEVDQGDEALAVKPFKGEVDRSKPTGWVMPKNAGTAPDGNLKLRYCHNYRCFDAKNAARYCADPEKITFIAAALGLTMDIKTKQQEFFQMHEEDVVCLAIHPSGKYAATGQMAQKGKAKRIDMFVWEIATKSMVSQMNDFHLRAVCVVEFSPDGTKLASIGQDDDNSLAIYDWSKKMLLTTVKVDKAKVTALSYKNDTEFMTCGLKHVKFYTANGKNVKALRGTLDASQQSEAFLCGVYAGNIAVCGSHTGNLIPFNGTASGKSVQAHTGGVGTLCFIKSSNVLVSGGADGKVLLWNCAGGKLTKTGEFCNMSSLSKYIPGIVSLDARPDGSTLLVGTRGGEIWEVGKNGKGDMLLQGHYDGELWGCAVSPNEHKYVTCGGDKTIRLWDSKKYVMLAGTKPLENDVRAIDWAPNGKFIVAADYKGKIMILDPTNLNIKDALQSTFTKVNQWLEDIKVSPDNTMVAFGAHGGPSPVEVMSIKSDGKLGKMYTINAGLTSALLHLDWSVDSSHVVVNSQAYELKFVGIQAKKNTAASGAKDFEWATWTCKLGFPVQGVFQSVDYSDVNTVCRSNNKKILASGDDNQKVNLFKYPCVVEKAQCKSYIGHSSHVTRVKFSYDDTRLYSTGGNDKAVIVWRTDFGVGGDEDADASAEAENAPEYEDDPNESYIETKVKRDKYGRAIGGPAAADEEEEDEDPNALFKSEKVGTGDEFLAVKPWIGAIKAPSDWKTAPVLQSEAPKVDLTLEYVHGYRAKDCRNNVRYLKSGKIVYHAAALGIVSNPEKTTQKFFNLHTDDITSMDVHPNGVFVATGEIGPKPFIYVWDSNSMQVIFKFAGGPGGLEKGIANLAFSPSGKRLVGCAVDDNHKVGVYDTEIGVPLAVDKGDTALIVELRFKNDNEFVSVGPKHYKYWTVQNKQMTSKKGQFGQSNNLLRCVAFNGETCLTGAADGSLHTWSGNSLGKTYPLHKGGLDALFVSNQYIITGGGDGIIIVSDLKYTQLMKLQVDTLIKTSFSTKLRSACFSEDHKNILIGTFGSEIYELAVKDPKISATTKPTLAREIVKGHYTPNKQWTNEIWGLAMFSDNDRYITCSDDATLRIWSSKERKQLAAARLDIDASGKVLPPDPTNKYGDLDESGKGRSLDISPDGKFIAVGCKDGTYRIFDEQLKQIHMNKVAKEWISELKFSPDGTKLAVGSHDNAIYIVSVPNFQKKLTMKKHSSFITHLDWSENSSALHSNCGAYELLFWDVNSGKQVTGGATAYRDERWATWTCVLGWPVQGIWPPATSGDDINYVSRSSGKPTGEYEVLAVADDFGKVKIMRYPSIQKGSKSVVGVGHSSHVTCVKFSPNDELLVSTGGEDNCVFQWKMTPSV